MAVGSGGAGGHGGGGRGGRTTWVEVTRAIRQQLPAPLGGSGGHFASRGGSILRRDVIGPKPPLRAHPRPPQRWVSFIGTRAGESDTRGASSAQSTNLALARVPLTTEVRIVSRWGVGASYVYYTALDTRRCTQGNCVVFSPALEEFTNCCWLAVYLILFGKFLKYLI